MSFTNYVFHNLAFPSNHFVTFCRVRGLGHLVRSKNIHTVGDLCTLSEYDVHNLPIKSPKVLTMRRVLQTFAGQVERKAKDREADSDTG